MLFSFSALPEARERLLHFSFHILSERAFPPTSQNCLLSGLCCFPALSIPVCPGVEGAAPPPSWTICIIPPLWELAAWKIVFMSKSNSWSKRHCFSSVFPSSCMGYWIYKFSLFSHIKRAESADNIWPRQICLFAFCENCSPKLIVLMKVWQCHERLSFFPFLIRFSLGISPIYLSL